MQSHAMNLYGSAMKPHDNNMVGATTMPWWPTGNAVAALGNVVVGDGNAVLVHGNAMVTIMGCDP